MDIQRTDNEILLRLPANIDTLGLQRMIDYLKYKEATAESEVDQVEIDKLAKESKASWWKENKHRFVKWGGWHQYCFQRNPEFKRTYWWTPL